MTDEQLDERMAAIEALLRQRVADYMASNHPGAPYDFDAFGSDNGEDDWLAPMAASLDAPTIGVTDAYGLCDAGTDTVEEQAEFLLGQIIDELRPQVRAWREKA